MDQQWLEFLTPDEIAALRETKVWTEGETSRFKKMLGVTRKPLEYAYSKVPESVRDSVAKAIYKVLTSMRDGTADAAKPATVVSRIEAFSGPLGEQPNLLDVDLRHLDQACQEGLKRSKNACTMEGAATGAAGLPGLVVDVPALYGLLFHMIAEVALCYGYRVDTEQERSHILKVLDIGHHTEKEARKAGMDQIQSVQTLIREGAPVKDVERFAIQKGLQAMARHLALALIQRKVAQSVVLVGGVIGAGVNRQLAGEVGEVAFHAYRRRFLLDLAKARSSGHVRMPKTAQTPQQQAASRVRSKLPRPPSYDG